MSTAAHPQPPPSSEEPGSVWRAASQAFDRWIDDDPQGLSDLVTVMTPILWHVVRSYGLSRELAEDVIQSTWLALVRRHASIVDSTAIGGWLATTARREAWRTAKSSGHQQPVADDDLDVRLPRQRSTESEVVERDRDARLWEAVDGLPERCQRLLRIVAFENRPDYSAIAEDLEMPIGSIGPTRGRCLAKLRVALIEAGHIQSGEDHVRD